MKTLSHSVRWRRARCPGVLAALVCATLLLAPRTTVVASTDYAPAVTRLVTCSKYYTTGYGKQFVVIHDMEGYYLTGISYLNRCDLNTSGSYNVAVSIHYCVNGLKDYSTDAERGEISQLVRESNYAWHAGCWNRYSTGTEHEGFASNPAWYTEEMYQASALLHRHLCDKFGIAKDRNHVIAHGQKSVAGWPAYASANFGIDPYCNTHTDPGPYWDWTHFMNLLIGGADDAAFVSKTVANGANFNPGQAFSCTFTMNNNGTTTWTASGGSGYTLNNYSGTLTAGTFATPPAANVAPGANASFTVNFTAPAAPGSYTANFQMNSASLVYFGDQVALTINVVSPGPTITTQPASKTVAPGVNTTFSVAATGSGALSYQWRKDGANLANGTKYSGVTGTTLTITNVQQTDVGNYNVNVTDANGTVASASAALAVSTLVAFNETFEACNMNNWGLASNTASPGAVMLASSTAQNHTSGGTCSALVTNSLCRMYRNIGAEVAGRGKATFWIYDTYAGLQTRVFTEVRSYSGSGFEQGSLSQLLAIGKYNTVTLPGEVFDATKYQGRIVNGANAGWFNLNGAGAPIRSTGWHKFEIERLADSSTVNWYVDGVLCRTFTGLTLPAWDCVVVGSVGSGSTVGDAWVDDFKVEYYDPPTISSSPTNKTVVAGNSATFTVVAANTVTGYQWRKNGVNLINGGNISGATTATLTVSNAQAGDAANYDAVVSNGAGPVYSAAAALKVAPAITSQPVASTNLPGGTATFTVAAAGQTTLTYRWRLNGTNLSDGGRISGAASPTLLLNTVLQGDEGNYSVVVTNTAGTATSASVPLMVLDPPFIITPPADQAVDLGANVTFTVVASGTPPLFYQWRVNDTNIAGATASSFNIASVQLADSGGYSVQVSNAVDTVISLEGVLSLITPPPQLSALDSSGGNFTLTWSALGGKTYRVQYKDNLDDTNWTDLAPDVTATGPTASKSDPLGPAQRFYRVLALD
ncbi:MAG: hypothetical protein EXS35_15655 [Pedosphaera sp.]|nr:hypothetical protein [Pedosphaera sp.]